MKAKQILLRAKELDAKPPDLLKNALEALSAGQPDLVSAVIQNNANKGMLSRFVLPCLMLEQ